MATRLYGLLWKWHFAVGLAACPLVALVALSGALYSFQPELERWAAPELHDVESGASRRLDDLVAIAETRCEIGSIFIPGPNDRSYTFYCRDDRALYLDPVRGVVLGENDTWMAELQRITFALHWELVLGERGRRVVEWATSWAILLFVSGAILWWPRGKRRGAGVLWPRARLVGRQWVRDLHAVLGAYALPVVLVLASTGLMWTIHAGDERWNRVAGEAEHVAPRSKVADTARIGVDAALVAAGIDPATESRSIDVAVLGAKDGADEPYWFYLREEDHHAPSRIESGLVDAYSGAVIHREGWNDRTGILATIDQSRYALHVGAILGWPGRIAACLASLIVAALCITGPWMWWKRRPRERLGVPPAARAPRTFYVVLAALGWLLPMVGYTLLVVVAIEGVRWLVVRAREATPV